jgi:hypothetical protein
MGIVLVALASFVYFYEIRGREAREEAERVEGLLLDFDADEVASLDLETEEGSIELAREDDRWRILQPYALDADDAAVNSLLSQLESASQERLVVEEAEDLAPFGLDAPPVKVGLVLEDGERLSLKVGGGTPVGYNVYVMRDDEPGVYMTPAALKDNLDKSLFDLRNKNVLEFEDNEVEGVDIETDSFRVSLRREPASGEGDAGPGEWQITAPSTARADADEVSASLRRLRTDRATAFVAEQPTAEELEAFGLSEPRYRVTVWTTGDASQTVEIGAESGEPAGVFARRRGSEPVFVVPESLVDAVIPDSIDDLRDPVFVTVERSRISAIELDGESGTYRIERRVDQWRITEPRDLEADASEVSTLLSALTNLRADGFAEGPASDPRYGLDEPVMTVTAHLNPAADQGGEPAETEEPRALPESGSREVLLLRVGGTTEVEDEQASTATSEGEEAEEPAMLAARYVALGGDPTVYIVRDTALEPFRAGLFELRAKTLVTFAQEDLTRLEVVADGALYDLEKRDEVWIRTGQQEAEIEATRISDLLWNFNYLRMEGVAAEWDPASSPPDLEEFGLLTPAFRITAYVGDQIVGDVRIGRAVPAEALADRAETAPAEQVYVLVDDSAAVFQVGARLRDAVESLAGELAGS